MKYLPLVVWAIYLLSVPPGTLEDVVALGLTAMFACWQQPRIGAQHG